LVVATFKLRFVERRQPFRLVKAKALTYVGRSFSFDQMTSGHLPAVTNVIMFYHLFAG